MRVAAGVFATALVLTRSRGFWVSAALGLVALWLAAPPRAKGRIAVYGAASVLAVAALALALFPSEVALLTEGTVERFLTLSSAASNDISLVNRFAETAAAWEQIRANPVLGYGWGVQLTRYDMVYDGTLRWAFIHNGYVALWFKTGLVGLLAVVVVWFGGLVRALLASRSAWLRPEQRACALGAAATLTALSLATVTSGPFSIQDQMLVVTLLMGLANGVSDRSAAVQASRR